MAESHGILRPTVLAPSAALPAAAPSVASRAAGAPTPPLVVLGADRLAPALKRAARALGVELVLRPDDDDALPRPAFGTVVTAAAEHVPAERLAALAVGASARPAPTLLAVAQDRAREKAWLDARAGHAAPWRPAASAADLARAVAELLAEPVPGAEPAVWVKPQLRRRGVGPVRLDDPARAAEAWARLGERPVVVERALAVDVELTVLVARSPSGATAVHPVAQTGRDASGRAAWYLLPAPVDPRVARKAINLATFYAARLAVEGLLAVELFGLADGRLVVNELVPAPHHAFDGAELACRTGQAEQLVRAVCDLPLGDPRLLGPIAAVPLRGVTREEAFGVELPEGVRVVWYSRAPAGAASAEPGGLLVAAGETEPHALARARRTAARLACGLPPRRGGRSARAARAERVAHDADATVPAGRGVPAPGAGSPGVPHPFFLRDLVARVG